MDLYKLGFKFYLREPTAADVRQCIPLFHRWIQQQSVVDHLLLDVHDYAHVPQGPGILLVAHEGNFNTDQGMDGVGLMYTRKQPLKGDLTARLRSVARIALQACATLEACPDLPGWKFRTDDILVFANDRLLAPNTPATLAQFQPFAAPCARQLFGMDAKEMALDSADPRERFGVRLRRSADEDVATVLRRLG